MCGANPDRLLFSSFPLTENMLLHGTDDALAVKYCYAALTGRVNLLFFQY